MMSEPVTHAAAEPDQIALWVEEDLHGHLVEFFPVVDQMPLDALVDAIRQACQNGFGLWMEPPRKDPAQMIRPATHLVEISLFAVTGSGLTLEEAARSWRTAARHILQNEEAA